MIGLGLILIVLAVLGILGGIWVCTSNNTQVTFHAGFINVDLAPLTLFLAGAISVLLLWLGLWMMTHATKRGIRNRRERKQLERDQRTQEEQLAATRAKLERERAQHVETPRPQYDAPTTSTSTIPSAGTSYGQSGSVADAERRVAERGERDGFADGSTSYEPPAGGYRS